MSNQVKKETADAILSAILAKRDGRSGRTGNIAQLEAELLADIESFDLDAAERNARQDYVADSGASRMDSILAFPDLPPSEMTPPLVAAAPVAAKLAPTSAPPADASQGLLAQLRQKAESRQREQSSALAQRTEVNEAIDQALRQLFFYLHEFVQQLNIVKPEVPRIYPLIEHFQLQQLEWHEGFADYRTQSQSAGALVELVSLSYQLRAHNTLKIERDGPAVERFRGLLFDYGLQFACKEFKNERRYVERAEFEIPAQLSISIRWRADFAQGKIILETRNLERLGSLTHTLRPQLMDQALFDEFGRLVLGEANRFRDLIRR